MPDDLLPRIPGHHIADALLTLPHPELVEDGAIMDTFIDVPGIGRVRLTAHEAQARPLHALLLDGRECLFGLTC